MRVRCFRQSLVFCVLLLPFAVHAGPKLVRDRTDIKGRTNTLRSAETQQATDPRQIRELPPGTPHGKFYNQCSGQQFVMKPLGTLEVFNGGLGEGDGISFFCGAHDELNFGSAARQEFGEQSRIPLDGSTKVKTERGQEFRSPSTLNHPDYDRSEYSFYSIQDNCREAGFGNVKPDNRRVVIGISETILHCDARGTNGNLPFSELERLTNLVYGGDHYRERWDEPHRNEDLFVLNRNRISSDDFSYGRYLIRMVPADRLPEKISDNSSLSLMGLKYATLSDYFWYKQESLPPFFLDMPYNKAHQEWMTCGQFSGARGMNTDQGPVAKGDEKEKDEREKNATSRLNPDRLEHYRDLYDVVLAVLGNEIRDGKFFHYPPVAEPESVNERMSLELVGSIYSILSQFLPAEEDDTFRIAHGCTPGDEECQREREERSREQRVAPYRNDPVVPIFSCPAKGIVEYKPDKHRICIDPPVANDCLSQKTRGSDRHHNVEHCDPSHGRFDETHGLVDEKITLPRGYELYADTVGGGAGHIFSQYQVLKSRRQPSVDSFLPAAGYSPVIVAKIIHSRIHAFSCEKLGQCLHKLRGPARDLQERLATVAESLAYTTLCRAGYCDYDFGPQSRDVITAVGEDPSGDITGITVAREFYFQDSCRGFGGIALGPYCTDMFNMTRIVESGDAELAGIMAQFYSNLGEIEKPLPLKHLSGVVREEVRP